MAVATRGHYLLVHCVRWGYEDGLLPLGKSSYYLLIFLFQVALVQVIFSPFPLCLFLILSTYYTEENGLPDLWWHATAGFRSFLPLLLSNSFPFSWVDDGMG